MADPKELLIATELRAKSSKLYDTDSYVWALEQAELLRAGRFEALDLDNLIEEVEGLADTKLSAVLSHERVVMEHLLKLQHSPPPIRATAGGQTCESTGAACKST